MKHFLNTITAQIVDFGIGIQNDWFFPGTHYMSGWPGAIWMFTLYVLGFFQWGRFFSWGDIDFRVGDWYDISGPRLALLTDALTHWQLPLHSANPTGLKGVTDRILSIPDFFLSPQFILLRFMGPGTFVLVDTLIFFTIGYLGLLLLGHKLNLSCAVFTILFFLFNFNGHITTHLAAGHITWMGYFLLPFYILLLLEIPDKTIDWGWILNFCLLTAVMFLQGSFHIFVWCLLFLGLIGLFHSNYRLNAFLGVVFSLLINFFRILPVSQEAGELGVGFMTGFLNLDELLGSMLKLVQPADALLLTTNKITHYIAWWEVDHYIGWVGFLFVLVFGIAVWFFIRKEMKNPYAYLYGPIISIVVLSVGRISNLFFILKIPLLDAERVPSRFLIIPLLFLFVLGSVGLQYCFNQFKLSKLTVLLYWGSLLILVNDLQQHFELWTVSNVSPNFLPGAQTAVFDTIQNHSDPAYIWSILIGLAVSSATLLFLALAAKK